MPDERLDDLFALPPDDFTAARNDLVAELRGAGNREEARRVAQLRRPTLAAWAVNQAVRANREAYDELLAAGRQVRVALRRAMSGAGSADVTDATRSRRQRIAELTDKAMDRLAEAGHDPGGHRQEVAATFDAASADDEAAEQVAAARLSRPLTAPATFGELSPLMLAGDAPEAEQEAPAGPPAPDDEQAEARRAEGEARRAIGQARQRAQEASAAALQLRHDADAAEHEWHAAVAEAEQAEADAERARRLATQAREQAATRQRRAERLDEQAADAKKTADRRARELENVERKHAGK